jgi:hypothetical protein
MSREIHAKIAAASIESGRQVRGGIVGYGDQNDVTYAARSHPNQHRPEECIQHNVESGDPGDSFGTHDATQNGPILEGEARPEVSHMGSRPHLMVRRRISARIPLIRSGLCINYSALGSDS